ncbi:MAG TPA: hypothetical protein PLM75_07000 [bacterium]|nr:hypothetical protein [bacterium]HPP87589.1 hypothetical protein [bacterium]
MDSGQKTLLITIVGALLAGLIVILFNPKYRPDYLLKTNKTYYPAIEDLTKNAPEFEDKLSADE